jgi:hypothetical protein
VLLLSRLRHCRTGDKSLAIRAKSILGNILLLLLIENCWKQSTA